MNPPPPVQDRASWTDVNAGEPLRLFDVPITKLRSSLIGLRSPGPAGPAADNLSDLPIRAVLQPEGSLEIVDGFKRVQRWDEAGMDRIPVLVEPSRTPAETKILLLRSNAPPRTVTPMDEARVIDSDERIIDFLQRISSGDRSLPPSTNSMSAWRSGSTRSPTGGSTGPPGSSLTKPG